MNDPTALHASKDPISNLRGLPFRALLANKWTLRAAVLLFVFIFSAWGLIDVRRRGQSIPGRPDLHSTDFTVYTAAGKALMSGKDPYQATNFRGWYYLYPPLTALMASPLSSLDTQYQILIWFGLSLALAFGCFRELERIWKTIAADEGPTQEFPSVQPWSSKSYWIAAFAGATVLLPALDCLQRGQMGIALVYALLLGLRLILTGRTWWAWALGGSALSWAVVAKLVPALPAVFLLAQLVLVAFYKSQARSRAASSTAGFLVGLFLFTFALPSAFVGWETNLQHLNTWSRRMVVGPDAGKSGRFDVTTDTNQSLWNSSYMFADKIRGRVSPLDDKVHPLVHRNWLAAAKRISKMREADTFVRNVVWALRGVTLALLLAAAVKSARQASTLALAAAFGLASLAVVLVSPVAYRHYFVFMLPAALFVPLWLERCSRRKAALWMAAFPAALTIVHFLAMPWSSAIGLLGLGTFVWFTCAAGLFLVSLPTPIIVSSDRPVRDHGLRVDGPHARHNPLVSSGVVARASSKELQP